MLEAAGINQHEDGWMDGAIGEDCQSSEPQDRERGTKQPHAASPGTLLYTPGVGQEGGQGHTHMHIYMHILHTQTLIH